MRKLFIVSSLMIVALITTNGVYAAEEIVTEPSTFDNWVDIVTDFASLKNFIVTVGGLSVITFLLKLRGVYKFIKSPDGTNSIYNHVEKFLARLSTKPELLTSLIKVIVSLPIAKGLFDKAIQTADKIDLELEGRIIDLKAKLGADVFATSQDKLQATQYLAKLEAEYENIKSSQ